MENNVEIIIYGAEQICASCVNLPSSKETCEWLEAAISRKFQEQPLAISYVDIFNPPSDPDKQKFAQKVIEEDMFYPVVVINDVIVAEGNPRLKVIFSELEKYGFKEK
jgi:disulfide oxidoreductase YuzD